MTLYNKANEIVGKYVCVTIDKYKGMKGEVIEVGARDGGLYHGCVKIRFDSLHPDWTDNAQWFLSGWLTIVAREV